MNVIFKQTSADKSNMRLETKSWLNLSKKKKLSLTRRRKEFRSSEKRKDWYV